jgi:hypothetical protein
MKRLRHLLDGDNTGMRDLFIMLVPIALTCAGILWFVR